MQQIPTEETCPNGHTYSVIVYLRTGPATVGTFCKGGTVTSIMARYKGRLSLKVPGNTAMDPDTFKFKVGPEVTSSKLNVTPYFLFYSVFSIAKPLPNKKIKNMTYH